MRETEKYIREKRRELNQKIAELKEQYRKDVYKIIWPTVRLHYRHFYRRIYYMRSTLVFSIISFWVCTFFFASLSSFMRILLAFFAVISTGSGIIELVFLFQMDTRILKPLAALAKAAKKVASGNFDVFVDIPFRPETAALVKTFNGMVAALKKSDQIKKGYEENRKNLIANISHDLKTPVTAVLGYIDAIHDIEPGNLEKTEKYLSIIKSNTIYLNRLIDDLFLFSKLDVHKLEFNFETIDLTNYLHDLMEELSLDLEEHKIIFTFLDLLPEHTQARIDSKQFCRIVRNLLDNAKKYGPQENLKISVIAKKMPSADSIRTDGFVLRIADNGTGIPEEKMAHLFERFYRADVERTKNIESTGLGLAIAKELAEAHGGTIKAYNVPSGGLTFDIWIPLPEQDGGTDKT